MPLYHATLVQNLKSIHRHGLGAGDYEQLWKGCERGVYLSVEPFSCMLVMIEQYALFGDETIKPRDRLADIRIIVIDDSRYQTRLLTTDPSLPRVGIFRYQGVIDVVGMPVLKMDEVMREFPEDQKQAEDKLRREGFLVDAVIELWPPNSAA